jgi:hypothetical protein
LAAQALTVARRRLPSWLLRQDAASKQRVIAVVGQR